MNQTPILRLCARVEGHPEQYKRLRNACTGFDNWQHLLQQAEREGISPLVVKHLKASESEYPTSICRSLVILERQHKYRSKIIVAVLKEVVTLLQENDITPLVIKGAALCHTIYPEPHLRPMRDIDVLLHKDEVDRAQSILEKSGFNPSKSPIPPNHFHLPPLMKNLGGIPVCVELHRGLYPSCPPYYQEIDFEKMVADARPFSFEGCETITMGDEDALWYIYQHGLCMPLTYEPYRLINCADIFQMVETCSSTLNWQLIEKKYPALYNALPLLDHLSPWNPANIPDYFRLKSPKKTDHVTRPFSGWPTGKIKLQKEQGRSLGKILRETFLPPFWWMKVYYGLGSFWSVIRCLLVTHPKTILWWMKLYSHIIEERCEVEKCRIKKPKPMHSFFKIRALLIKLTE